jgi:hypothetical protein
MQLALGLAGPRATAGVDDRAEGLAMMIFSMMRLLPLAIVYMMFMGLFVKMSNGANYSVVLLLTGERWAEWPVWSGQAGMRAPCWPDFYSGRPASRILRRSSFLAS